MAAALAVATPFIVGWEDNKLKSYQDIVGVWTVCGGLTEGVGPHTQKTQEQCDHENAKTVLKYAQAVDDMVTVPMTPERHAAITSLAYNVGITAVRRSTLIRKLNQGKTVEACLEFLYAGRDRQGWTKAGGKRVKGLVYRRLEEMDMCMRGAY